MYWGFHADQNDKAWKFRPVGPGQGLPEKLRRERVAGARVLVREGLVLGFADNAGATRVFTLQTCATSAARVVMLAEADAGRAALRPGSAAMPAAVKGGICVLRVLKVPYRARRALMADYLRHFGHTACRLLHRCAVAPISAPAANPSRRRCRICARGTDDHDSPSNGSLSIL